MDEQDMTENYDPKPNVKTTGTLKPSWLQESNPGSNDGLLSGRSPDPVRPLPTPGPNEGRPNPTYRIFVLIDPRDRMPQFVGVTSLTTERMFLAWDAMVKYEPNIPLSIWMDELAIEDKIAEFRVLEETKDRSRVSYWIRKYRDDGYALLNLSDDGYEIDAAERQGISTYRHKYDTRYNKGRPPEGTPAADMEEWERHQETKRQNAKLKYTGIGIETTQGTSTTQGTAAIDTSTKNTDVT